MSAMTRVAAFIVLSLTCASWPAVAAESDRLAEVKRLIVERRCYELYWQGGIVQGELGTSRPLKIVFEDNRFYARIDPAGFVGPNRQAWRLNYIGETRDGRMCLLVKNYEFDLDEKFATGPSIQDTLTMPSDCTPHYNPSSAEKDRMMENVAASMRQALHGFADHPAEGLPQYPNEVRLVIGDFNVDYPYTYVLVEEPPELYRIALHDPDGDADADDTYQREGKYIVGEAVTGTNLSEEDIKEATARLTAKIRAHGIPRTIVLRDGAGKQGGASAAASERSAGAKPDSDRR
jgi:hypothetical protein